MIYVSDRETLGAPIRANRTAPSKVRRNEALAALAARADQEFAGVAGYSDLTDRQRLRLFAALLAAKRHFDFRETVKAIPKDTAAAALLDNVRQSISKVAEFGEMALGLPETKGSNGSTAKPATPQGAKALRMLEAGGERWARQQTKGARQTSGGVSSRHSRPSPTTGPIFSLPQNVDACHETRRP